MSLCPHGYSANFDCPICPCPCGMRNSAECAPGRNCHLDDDLRDTAGTLEDPFAAARGILVAIALSAPLWLAALIYLLGSPS